MKRLLGIWLCLFPPFAAGQWLVWWFGLGLLDLRFHAFVQALTIPFLQAAVLSATVYRAPSGGDLRGLLAAVLGNGWLVALVAADALVLTLGWRSVIDLSGAEASAYLASKAALAAVLALVEVCRAPSGRGRGWLLFLSAVLGVWTASYVVDWREPLSRAMLDTVPRLVQLGIIYGGAFAIGLIVLLEVADTWLAGRRAATSAVEAAVGVALLAAALVLLSLYDASVLRGHSAAVVKSCSCLFTTCVFAALVLGRSESDP